MMYVLDRYYGTVGYHLGLMYVESLQGLPAEGGASSVAPRPPTGGWHTAWPGSHG